MKHNVYKSIYILIFIFGMLMACSDDSGESTEGSKASGCSREELSSLVDDYFEGLEDHDASSLPISDDVKFTENAEQIELDEGMWQKAGNVQFKRSAIDTERCGTHTEAILDEDGVTIIFGVRLQLQEGEITEIETYVVREGTYFLFYPQEVANSEEEVIVLDNEEEIEVIDPGVRWEELVDEDQRSTREELNHIADLYFESFGPDGYVAPMFEDCYRWENGFQTTSGDCSAFLPPEGEGQGGITHRRYPIADVEAGIAIGYVLFRDSIDFHMFKIIDGKIRLIEAVITGPDYTSSGWDEQEE